MASVETVLSVSNLNEYVSRLLENDLRLRSVRVSGEITGYKRHSSGHLYFSLKDENALIRCVMFRSNALKLKFEPSDGMQVILSGSVSIYVKDGQYQFYATGMRPSGEGELYKQFLELRDKLGAEGLFERKRPIPFLPRCVGVVTSETGAAFHDIRTVIARRFPTMRILLAPALVQGGGAAQTIIDGIALLNGIDEVDVIIVGRGGGSYEDLFCFNDEALARAIFASKKPVISAVGHEIDFTIADFVSDLRAPTPSAAAELCVPELEGLIAALDERKERMSSLVAARLTAARQQIGMLSSDSVLVKPSLMLDIKRERLDSTAKLLEQRAGERITAAYLKLDGLAQRLGSLDPFAVLKRGYAIVSKPEGETVYGASELARGDALKLTFNDGSAEAEVGSVVLNTSEN